MFREKPVRVRDTATIFKRLFVVLKGDKKAPVWCVSIAQVLIEDNYLPNIRRKNYVRRIKQI